MSSPLSILSEKYHSDLFGQTGGASPRKLSFKSILSTSAAQSRTLFMQVILLRFPDIKFLFSHNGGALPFLADRIGAQHIDEMIAKNNDGLRLRDIASTRNLYLDTSI
ncbi:uncharacterized protein A1O9_08229 [Exophiala aquamarina CBS 119918]|uniref:Amidohydrolase-related domain-containing protein n=1 Tax=Exophiala aquamarina CBS 119918 TaxID=1182545 RepID=A0A072P5V2_9EURO|nr:uncharacterized protein A1O9_08229 [Exophiala aquamarina CBS 119918]KEF55479.1 hypothetical protein A1O9_08229 [Exophiala aquamarina CBS 119918]